ncbi:LemA family protein [Lactobacillus hominis]|uniref:LemA family protein n=1 Tax=Lactobacillus hominis DSM 23910 = CRBIP 24.179 TaxID=1423758 RepID=I7L5L5_9LACO|nr:LemA family protein [Lactobacillus hominis]KRM84775.1 LemA-like protein [Lactobacillus hominis DSM 23910 = CRBIP 24.179]MCT3347819.1 LemA family protein [Lactobacillus hominis]CCI81447.1 LemA family protein [Lactobacillus hominis DSM 23910 = CRBIP 24.179]
MGLTWVIIVILILLVAIYIAIYNGLQKAKIHAQEAWSQIDVQLKRRNDLIPNLVETVKGYAKHESQTFEKVVELRNQLVNTPASDHQKQMEVSNQITDSLKSIFALSENYPDLKANQNFLKLQEELTNTENKIAYSRQLYNSTVAFFDQKLATFPSNLVAKIHGFTKMNYLETPTQEKVVPQVKF